MQNDSYFQCCVLDFGCIYGWHIILNRITLRRPFCFEWSPLLYKGKIKITVVSDTVVQ